MTVAAFAPLAGRRFRSETFYVGGHKEFLASVEIDGELHAAYPSATATLCSLRVRAGTNGEAAPTCAACIETAAKWDELDSSVPDRWRPDYLDEYGEEVAC